MSLDNFHPAVAAWFTSAFPEPTAPQIKAWPAIKAGRHTLIAAPTGSGKTLSAFLAAIDDLVRHGIEMPLPDETTVVYISPLKALSNDIRINLDAPIAGIRDKLFEMGLPDVEIRTTVRTGDTPQSERDQMRKRPPHIVVTTPESLYILLGSESGRAMLATTRTVIVDEIHAIVQSKRGSHLALSLERLEALCQRPITRIGLSATQKPISEVAKFLIGGPQRNGAECEIVDVGYSRKRDLAIDVPPVPLQAVMSGDVWELVYTRIAELIQQHRTTLIFVNTRRMAERAAKALSDKLGKEAVTSHHGSMSRELRLDAEQRLKRGELRALVATSSLELGIDVGDVDLVCQLSSPRAISAFLQRVGRSGHAVAGTPKGRLFPQSRDDLIECAALLDSVRRGELDELRVEKNSLDVLAQQIVAEVACREWNEAELLALCKRSYPYADLTKEVFTDILRMLAEGYTTRRGPRSAYLHRDAVNGVLRARKGARLTAITSGGAIPDTADYEVVMEPQGQRVGTVHEDFAVESLAGDIFQLGNTSYRILRVEAGRVRVEDAKGAPPTIPFWLGEAPGRTDELSFAVSRLRDEISERLDYGVEATLTWLREDVGLSDSAARQIVDYLGGAKAALGMLPTQTELAMERFFDESGGTQLVIHTPYGSRLNRAWGLALRKRFCRSFNFELQAAATEDAIVLSLSTSHSFPLDDVTRYLHSNSVCDVLTQALLDAPMFGVRWRWNATTSLALPRFQGGSKVPPQLQRMKSEDLLATVFPDQVACLENIVGERKIPEHPMVAQTMHDCLYEAIDLKGLENLLRNLESGKIHFVCRDLTAPSPLAAEVLTARPYAYLDDAPLEERRTQAVMSRQWGDINSTDDFGKLDPDAIDSVRDEAWPQVRSADELHEALMVLGFLTHSDIGARHWTHFLDELIAARRTTQLQNDALIWIAAERIPQFEAIYPKTNLDPPITAPEEFTRTAWEREAALPDIVRGRMTGLGPVTVNAIAESMALPTSDIDLALLALEREGFVMRGHFTPGSTDIEWCERHLLARIHRYTVNRLRREIEPVEPRDFMRFLFEWQRVAPNAQVSGPDALAGIIAQLEGFEAPAAAWETELLPARVAGYEISWLDDLCLAGRVVWSRMQERKSSAGERASGPVRATPIVLLQRRNIGVWTTLDRASSESAPTLSSRAQAVADYLKDHGASFFDEMISGTRLLQTELEDALAELVAAGIINSDSFAGLRALLVPASKRSSNQRRRGRRTALLGIADAGRWALLRRRSGDASKQSPETLEHIARTLLKRYGVVCWRLLAREADWLPPWRDLLRVYQRLEARGEIRGGRFIAGLSGEQFALPEAVSLLRGMRQKPANDVLVAVSGADPLNLVGSIVAGNKVPALTNSKILYRDGVPIATLISGEFTALEPMDAAAEWTAKSRLLRHESLMPAAADAVADEHAAVGDNTIN
jgi:ATP-dependent Lhr-like helicase